MEKPSIDSDWIPPIQHGHALEQRHGEVRKLVHDLRGPLTSLLLGIETLRDTTPDKRTAEDLTQLLNEVHRLSARLETASALYRNSAQTKQR